MLRISELDLVSHVPAVAVPPLVTGQAPLIEKAATNTLRVNTSSPTAFRNHAPAGNPQTLIQTSDELTPPTRHLDYFI